MLVRFKSESYGHVDYLESVASQLLKMLRVSSKIPSALSAEHLSGHLQHLRSALTLDDEQQSGDPDDDTISMRTRAKPLIDLLENAIENKEFVMWDYHR